jgi:hypothetical protein
MHGNMNVKFAKTRQYFTCILSFGWSPGVWIFTCRRFGTLCYNFTGHVNKNNWNEMARVFILVKVWLKRGLVQSKGGGTRRGCVRVEEQSVEGNIQFLFFSHCATNLSGPGPPCFRGLMITLRHTTLVTLPNTWLYPLYLKARIPDLPDFQNFLPKICKNFKTLSGVACYFLLTCLYLMTSMASDKEEKLWSFISQEFLYYSVTFSHSDLKIIPKIL